MPDRVDAMEVDGRPRSYTCHLPPGPSTGRRTLLIVLHGRRMTVSELRWMTHFDAVADHCHPALERRLDDSAVS